MATLRCFQGGKTRGRRFSFKSRWANLATWRKLLADRCLPNMKKLRSRMNNSHVYCPKSIKKARQRALNLASLMIMLTTKSKKSNLKKPLTALLRHLSLNWSTWRKRWVRLLPVVRWIDLPAAGISSWLRVKLSRCRTALSISDHLRTASNRLCYPWLWTTRWAASTKQKKH